MLLAATFILLAAACTGIPDRSAEAQRLKNTVSAMPGVSWVTMRHDNDIWQGTFLDLDVRMEGATEHQVEAVAAAINEAGRDDFDDYDRTVRISVADLTTIAPGDRFEPGQVATTTELARQLRARVRAGSIAWYGMVGSVSSRLQVDDAETTGAVIDAALALLGVHRSDFDVGAADRRSQPHWKVTGTLTTIDKQRIDRALTDLPGPAGWVGVHDGRITRLTFGVPDPATAYRDVVSAIKAVGTDPTHPLTLLWSWTEDPAGYDEPRFAGSIDLGECVDHRVQSNEAGALTPEASALQQRIRDEFESCA